MRFLLFKITLVIQMAKKNTKTSVSYDIDLFFMFMVRPRKLSLGDWLRAGQYLVRNFLSQIIN